MDFTICLANTNISIHSVYSGIFNICKDYLVPECKQPDIEVFSDEAKIKAEYENFQSTETYTQSLKSTEILLIQRLIAESLLQHNTLLMHGAVISVNNTAYMFTGRSGTGKTTQIQKWLENVPGSIVVNGDKPFVVVDDKNVYACGSPWCGKESMGSNIIVPLRSIIFMTRSNENHIETATFNEIFPALLGQTYHSSNIVLQRKTLALLLKLNSHVSFFNFYFDHFQQGAFSVPFEALTKLERK